MIILSQDKKEIINFDNVNLIRVQDDGSIVAYDNTYNEQTGVSSVLGKYETEERAKKILQEILWEFGASDMHYAAFGMTDLLFKKMAMYQMPEE